MKLGSFRPFSWLAPFLFRSSRSDGASGPIVIEKQGARPFGGRIVGDPMTGTLRGDHGYVEFQIPPRARRYPLLMIHGSSTKTWETTFDGRDGFKNIFLRRGFSVYLPDLPRTGRAGQACVPTAYEPRPDNDQASLTSWRLGTWLPGEAEPTFHRDIQFPVNDPRALDEFFRIQYPEFHALDNVLIETDAVAILLDEIGPAILLTHSSGSIRGWFSAIKSDKVATIVGYEPGAYVFPEGEMPEPIERADGERGEAGVAVSLSDFKMLTRMPIQIVWGDFIPTVLDPVNVGPRLTLDNRRINVLRSKLFAEAIERHGGKAEVVVLPEIGISGNTHFPMSDLNNLEIANLLSKFLQENGLDRY